MKNKLIAAALANALTTLTEKIADEDLAELYLESIVEANVPPAILFQGGECTIYHLGNPDGYHLVALIPTRFNIPKYLEAMTVSRLTREGFLHFEQDMREAHDLQTVLDLDIMRRALLQWSAGIPREDVEPIWNDDKAYAAVMWYYKDKKQFAEIEIKIKQLHEAFAPQATTPAESSTATPQATVGEGNDTLH